MTKKKFGNTTKLATFLLLLALIFILTACKATVLEDKSVTETKIESEENISAEENEAEQETETIVEKQIGNYYKAVTMQEGNLHDNKFFAAGFLGYKNESYFEKVVEDYGYAHLSRVPQWVDAGGNEAWVIIPKYDEAKISLVAINDFTLEDGTIFKSGDVIMVADESLIFFSKSEGGQANVDVIVSYGDESMTFNPSILSKDSVAQVPEFIWDISEYEAGALSDSEKTAILGQWIWEGEVGNTLTLTITEGSAETNSENDYFMIQDSFYPGADKMGPIGGTLEFDGITAIYTVNVSEGSFQSLLEVNQEEDSLTFTWIGQDFSLGLRTIGESITFKKIIENQ